MKLIGEDVQEQTKQALTNMGHILEAAESSFANGLYQFMPIIKLIIIFVTAVVKTTVLLADIKDYPKVNETYARCELD